MPINTPSLISKGAPIAWIGLGSMGIPMSKRLHDAGYMLRGYNRTHHDALNLLPFPLFPTPEKAAEGADLVILMLRDGRASKAVLSEPGDLLTFLKSGQILINMSTVSPEDAQNEANLSQEKGVIYFDIPVSGSVVPAQRGELLLLGGGEVTFRPHIANPMAILGKSIHWFGPAGSGMAAKLAINYLLAAHMQSLAETLIAGDSLGLDRKILADALLDSPLATPFYRIKMRNVLEEDYKKAFSASLMKKDLDLLLSALLSRDRAIPETLSHARTLYHRILAKGQGDSDMSVIHDLLKIDAEGS